MKKYIYLSIVFCFSIYALFGTNRVVISEIMYDSTLDEQIATGKPYSNGEYIELYNFEKTSLDLTGWKLTGGGKTEIYTFPANTIIAPEGFIVVAYQYKDSNFKLEELYTQIDLWSKYTPPLYQRKIILSNSGETVSLIDNTGKVIDFIVYDGTSNKTKPNRLHAENADAIDGLDCVSLQRSKVLYDNSGVTVFDPTHWYADRVTPYAHSMTMEPSAGDLDLEDNNYVHTRTYVTGNGSSYYDQVSYYNGLGYLEQTIDCKSVNPVNDLVLFFEYDGSLKKNKEWLSAPVASNNGAYIPKASIKEAILNYYHDSAPFSEIQYESLASDLIANKCQPGEVFRRLGNEKITKCKYGLNTDNQVMLFKFRGTNIELSGYYPANTLAMSVIIDEDDTESRQFTDSEGHLVLSQIILNDDTADTYYIYDNFGRLVFVMPPEGSAIFKTGVPPSGINEDFVQQYCFYYQYDGRGNMIQRHQPGRDYERFFYDAGDRLIRYRDGNGDLNGFTGNVGITEKYYYLWINYTYDEYGRLTDQTATKESVMNPVDPNPKYLAKYRYGGALYTQGNEAGAKELFVIPDYLSFSPVNGVVNSSDIGECNVGLKIYEKLAVVDSTFMKGTTSYVERAFHYDDKGQLVQMVEKNPFGGICRNSLKYDFNGNLLIFVESNQLNGTLAPIEKITSYSYDDRGRLLSEKTSVDNSASAIVMYEYDDLGRIRAKALGQGDSLIVDSMYYNIQGNITKYAYSIGTDNLFESQLRYYDPQYSETQPSYKGNITEWEWKHSDEGVNAYSFSYQQDKLIDSEFHQNKASTSVKAYTEHMSYDLNGNILSLQRYGDASQAPKDNYYLEYEGNRILNLTGSESGHYVYDKNGNMTFDARNNLNIEYNILNLPNKIWDSASHKYIQYTYLADGRKVSTIDANGNGVFYQGSAVYRKIAGVTTLEGISFSEGCIVPVGNSGSPLFLAHYYLKDHLGSIRGIVDTNGEIQERNDYYPLGSRWDNQSSILSSNRYKYSGKELQVVGDLNYLDYGFRMYDSNLGRWLTIDPLADIYHSTSPFAFCGNNPISNIDYWGLGYWSTNDPDLIRAFLENYYSTQSWDMTGWEYSDDAALARLQKNDETGMCYYNYATIENDVVTVIGRKFMYLYVGELNAYSPNLWAMAENYAKKTRVGHFAYNLTLGNMDSAWITLQSLAGVTYPSHFNGNIATPKEKLSSGIETLSSIFLSYMTKLFEVPSKTLNAGQFNKLHSGTGVTAASHGGADIRSYNYVVRDMAGFNTVLPWINKFDNTAVGAMNTYEERQ